MSLAVVHTDNVLYPFCQSLVFAVDETALLTTGHQGFVGVIYKAGCDVVGCGLDTGGIVVFFR